MKGALINTSLGLLSISIRERLTLVRAAVTSSEVLGMLGNDRIARLLLERICTHEQVFVDVGAHIGSVIRGVGENSKPHGIIAIEAIPEKAAALRRRFPHVDIHCCAAGADEGEVSFYVALKQSGYSSLDQEMAAGGKGVRKITVPIRRLDDIVKSKDNVGVLKIDVEGAELGVLKGSTEILQRSRPLVMFESGPRDAAGFSKVAMWHFLNDINYAVIIPNRLAHDDAGLRVEGFVESHLYPRRTTNYFAAPRERRAAIRGRARQALSLPLVE